MGYDIGWIIPRLRNPGALWSCASSITVAVVGLFSKLIVELLNKTTVYNGERLRSATGARPQGVALLTVSNHHSCFDDPGLWGVLEAGVLCRGWRMRWSLAAHDICFTRALHAAFFALGKCVPVVRGAGVYQPAMDFCVERLRRGEWVHIFPEGRVNVDKEHVRFKWGVGRLVADCPAPPLILPVWHEGMDSVLPNKEPYILSFRKRVFLNVGEPIQIQHLLERLRCENASAEETRRVITERIQDELLRLRDHTHALIRRAVGPHALGLLANRTDLLVKPSARPESGDATQDTEDTEPAPTANGKPRDHEYEQNEHNHVRHRNHYDGDGHLSSHIDQDTDDNCNKRTHSKSDNGQDRTRNKDKDI